MIFAECAYVQFPFPHNPVLGGFRWECCASFAPARTLRSLKTRLPNKSTSIRRPSPIPCTSPHSCTSRTTLQAQASIPTVCPFAHAAREALSNICLQRGGAGRLSFQGRATGIFSPRDELHDLHDSTKPMPEDLRLRQEYVK
jgi:hypothetical protein